MPGAKVRNAAACDDPGHCTKILAGNAEVATPGLPCLPCAAYIVGMSRMSTKSKPATGILWRVYRIRGPRAVVISTLKASSAEEAIARAIDDLDIADEAERRRLFAREAS